MVSRSIGLSVGMVGQSVWSVGRLVGQSVWSVSRYGRSVGMVGQSVWSVSRLVWSVWWSGSVVSVGSAQALAILELLLSSTWVGLKSVVPEFTYHLKGG